MNKKQMLIPALLTLSLLNGCSNSTMFRASEVEDDDLVEVSYEAVDQMLLNLKQPLPKGSIVVINSLVNVDDLGQTLPFGRIVSDQISSALHRAGYQVMGMELPTEIFAKNDTGILQIPEKTKEGLNAVHANAVIIGTYAAGKANVYVSLRVVDIASQNIISSTDYSIPMGPDARSMATKPQPKQY